MALVRNWFADAYGDGSVQVLRSVSRPCGGLYEVAHRQEKCWLRVGGVTRRREKEVEAEGTVAAALAGLGVQIARPIARLDGHFAGSMMLDGEPVPAIAYEAVPGEPVEALTPTRAAQLGQALGRLHYSGVTPGGLPLAEPLSQALECVDAATPWLDAEDKRWLRSAVERHLAVVAGAAPAGATVSHGDLRLANALFVRESPTLFDLECLGLAPQAYDCACMWRSRVLENDFSVPKDWNYFKLGYERATQIRVEHWRLVPVLAVLRAVWTMSLPALPGATWGGEWVRDPEYWRAHLKMVRWFAVFSESGGSA